MPRGGAELHVDLRISADASDTSGCTQSNMPQRQDPEVLGKNE